MKTGMQKWNAIRNKRVKVNMVERVRQQNQAADNWLEVLIGMYKSKEVSRVAAMLKLAQSRVPQDMKTRVLVTTKWHPASGSMEVVALYKGQDAAAWTVLCGMEAIFDSV